MKKKYQILTLTEMLSEMREEEVDVDQIIHFYTHKQPELHEWHKLENGVVVLLFCSGETQVLVPLSLPVEEEKPFIPSMGKEVPEFPAYIGWDGLEHGEF